MVMKIWTFDKDKNSTKKPTTDGRTITMHLKENCSVINPIFIFNYDKTPVFNYCQYIMNYYFVDDIIMKNKNTYEVYCSLDVLASYKSIILNSMQFVERSASDFNVNLNDNIFEPQLNAIISMTQTESALNQDGTYIAKISSSSAPRFGVNYFCGSSSAIGGMIGRLYNLDNWDNFLSFGLEALQKTVFDFSQYIQEIYWLPLAVSEVPGKSGTGDTLVVGAWDIEGGTGEAQWFSGDMILRLGIRINAPSRYYNDYRDYNSTFTQFILDIPGCGSINLDPKDVYGGLGVNYCLDLKTGDASHVITSDNGNVVVTTIRCNYKCPISYATFNNNFVAGANQMISSVGEMAGSVVSGLTGNYGAMASGMGQGAMGLMSGVVNMGSITSHQNSSQGSMADIKANNDYSLTRYVHPCSSQAYMNVGRKLNEYRVLSALSGFVKCKNAKLDNSAYGPIKDEILNYMNNGFFIE